MKTSFLLATVLSALTTAQADAAILTFSGAASGTVNGVAFSATHSASGDTTNGHKSTDLSSIASPLGWTVRGLSANKTMQATQRVVRRLEER